MKKLCYYHGSDFDGVACGALAFNNGYDILPLEYGDKPEPVEAFYDVVMFADISNLDLMLKYMGLGSRVVWVDHHERTYNNYKDALKGAEIVYCNSYSAALGLWWYLTGNAQPSRNLLQISNYDTWNHDANTMDHHLGLMSFFTETPETAKSDSFHLMLRCDSQEEFLQAGRAIHRFTVNNCKKLVEGKAFEGFLQNVPCICMNTDNAQVFHYGGTGNKSYRFSCTFTLREPGLWTYSLRALDDTFDVSAIAEAFGGGGHRGAAGFSTTKPLFGE